MVTFITTISQKRPIPQQIPGRSNRRGPIQLLGVFCPSVISLMIPGRAPFQQKSLLRETAHIENHTSNEYKGDHNRRFGKSAKNPRFEVMAHIPLRDNHHLPTPRPLLSCDISRTHSGAFDRPAWYPDQGLTGGPHQPPSGIRTDKPGWDPPNNRSLS